MFVVSVVCCQVEVSATDWSVTQRRPTDCGASLCVIKKPRKRGGYRPARGLRNTNPQWVVAPVEKKSTNQALGGKNRERRWKALERTAAMQIEIWTTRDFRNTKQERYCLSQINMPRPKTLKLGNPHRLTSVALPTTTAATLSTLSDGAANITTVQPWTILLFLPWRCSTLWWAAPCHSPHTLRHCQLHKNS